MKKLTISIGFNPILGKLIQRLNRFMVLIEVDNRRDGRAYAHLPNSGRLLTVLHPGNVVFLRKYDRRPWRKSIYSVFAVKHKDITVIVDAQFSNILVKKAIKYELFSGLSGYKIAKENFKIEDSNVRLDFLLMKDSERFYIEVKIVTHVMDNIALFPDAPTARGRKHVLQLISLSKCGFKTGIIFSVQRPDAILIKPNAEIDPEFMKLLKKAVANNVKVFTLKSIFQPLKTVTLKPNEPPFIFKAKKY